MITVLGQFFLVRRTDDDPPPSPLPTVCRFKTSPCVRSKRPRVYGHHAYMIQQMFAWCRHTRGRFECTHGGVLEAKYGFFHVFLRAATYTKHTPRPPTTPRPQRHTPHNTTHNMTRRQRETRLDKRGRYKTRRQEKMKRGETRREKERRREGEKERRREGEKERRREGEKERRREGEKERRREGEKEKEKEKREDERENER